MPIAWEEDEEDLEDTEEDW